MSTIGLPFALPNVFATVADVLGIEPITSHGLDGDRVGKIVYDGDRPERWVDEPDAWLHGYWKHIWADLYAPVGRMDPAAGTITLGAGRPGGFEKGRPFYAVLRRVDRFVVWFEDTLSGFAACGMCMF